ncbi:hypothetical protein [Thomasclavelia sp.]|uniref:hypothetical protein n=1 Tax=Thomasclavelia sp. TaxID=3025757 RepID=UPI0025DAE123|nr:hypothetical protein [Thomasclavelia sp.]
MIILLNIGNMSAEKYDSTTGTINTAMIIIEKVFAMMSSVFTAFLNINRIIISTIAKKT